MKNDLEIPASRLCRKIELDSLDDIEKVKTTAFIGQERGLDGLEFFVDMVGFDTNKYNVFVTGHELKRNDDLLVEWLCEKTSRKTLIPDDQLLSSGFDPDDAKGTYAFRMPAGAGARFVQDFESMIDNAILESQKAASSNEQMEILKEKIYDVLAEHTKFMERLGVTIPKETYSALANSVLQSGQMNLNYIPIDALEEPVAPEGDDIDQKGQTEYEEQLKRYKKQQIEFIANSNKIQLDTGYAEEMKRFNKRLYDLMDPSAILKETTKEQIQKLLERDYIRTTVALSDYGLASFFDKIMTNLPKDISQIIGEMQVQNQGMMGGIMGMPGGENGLKTRDKYQLNLLVDNSELTAVPVIHALEHGYDHLIGTARGAEVTQGGQIFRKDAKFTDLVAGDLIKANGGYLVIDAYELLLKGTFNKFMEAVEDSEAVIESSGSLASILRSQLKSAPIDAHTSVIMVGDESLYYALNRFFPNFRNLFKAKAQFTSGVDTKDGRHLDEFAALIVDSFATYNGVEPHMDAVECILEEGLRESGEQRRIITDPDFYEDLVMRSLREASLDGAKKVSSVHVKQAMAKKRYRRGAIEERVGELIEDGTIKVDIDGRLVGQVNALSIYLGEFGKPSKLTVRKCTGKGTIRNIEEKANLSGNHHLKSVEIMESIIKGELDDAEVGFPITASVAFEQSYGGVDGDSATLAQVVGLVSALSGIGVKQNYAITGSANQYGDAQAIGGTNMKIEGFYKTCKAMSDGFEKKPEDGFYAVIIPKSNTSDLMLRDELVSSVQEGVFKVYEVMNYKEACELLLGKEWDDILCAMKENIYKTRDFVREFSDSMTSQPKKTSAITTFSSDLETLLDNPGELGKIATD
ncbi:hypothetical protein COV93_08725, partial [Candidatus Woesearchaeota archaeon CG11_big_fil_rev_8_21_14_0_20_43_8]